MSMMVIVLVYMMGPCCGPFWYSSMCTCKTTPTSTSRHKHGINTIVLVAFFRFAASQRMAAPRSAGASRDR